MSVVVTVFLLVFFAANPLNCIRHYDSEYLATLREEVRQMFTHAYDSYLKYAFPYDELRPLSCDGVDTWGSYSLTLIDALDTLAVMGNFTEFRRVVNILIKNADFVKNNINVSVFETNIRIIGGLLSAHLLSYRAGIEVEEGWPCNGPLLELAENVAHRLIAAFDTATGMPYGTVNLQKGVPHNETTVTCTAGVGTFILEFSTLSHLTGDPIYEELAMNALVALWHHRSDIGLVGNHIDIQSGRWTAHDSGIGAGIDSYFEYLAKGALFLQKPELMNMFIQYRKMIDKYLKTEDWYMWASMTKGQLSLLVFQSLEAYWPGVLSLVGDVTEGMKSLHNYHQVWKQYGFTPEFYNIPQSEAGVHRESYPLRPELIESVMYLYRATGDSYLLQVGEDILRSIQHSSYTPCGYATIKDVRDHRKDDRMESFFLAETTKYLYLLFDFENFMHNNGQHGTVFNTPWGECIIDAGGYFFNTVVVHSRNSLVGVLLNPGTASSAFLVTHCAADGGAFAFLRSVRNQTLVARVLSARNNKRIEICGQICEMYSKGVVSESRARQWCTDLRNGLGSVDDEEAHPTDTGALHCCSRHLQEQVRDTILDFDPTLSRGEKLSVHRQKKMDKSRQMHLEKESANPKTNKPLQSAKPAEEKERGTAEQSELKEDADEESDLTTASYDKPLGDGESNVLGKSKELAEYLADEDHSNSSKFYAKEQSKAVEQPDESAEDSNWRAGESEEDDKINLSTILSIFFSTEKKRAFEPQVLIEKIRNEKKYFRNTTWETQYHLLRCHSQPFLTRITLNGEFYAKP